MSNDKDKVIFLAFSNPNLQPKTLSVHAYSICSNNTFSLIDLGLGEYSELRCPVCGQRIGGIGWVNGTSVI